jgi:hypothetical protein
VSAVVEDLNTTATVIGYLVLTLLIAGVIFLAILWYEKWRYKLRRQRKHDIDWDRIREKWLLEKPLDRPTTRPQRLVNSDRVDTDVLDFTSDQLYNYQEDRYRDAS